MTFQFETAFPVCQMLQKYLKDKILKKTKQVVASGEKQMENKKVNI